MRFNPLFEEGRPIGAASEFAEPHGRQFEDGEAPGQGLRNAADFLRAAENVLAFCRLAIHPAFERGQYFGGVLDFVEEEGCWIILEKEIGILPRLTDIDDRIKSYGFDLSAEEMID